MAQAFQTGRARSERANPLALLTQQEEQRLPWLVPVRRERMAASPFAFFRGAAAVMAADLASQPHSGQTVQLCGDAHLLNFGFYGSPERNLLFDINDFDETHPGPFEWDLQRLAASVVLAARSLGHGEKQQLKMVRRVGRTYAKAMHYLAQLPFLEMWVWRPDLDRLIEEKGSPCLRKHLKSVTTRARQRNSRQAAGKLCEPDGKGGLRFRHDPPLVWRFQELDERWHGGVPLESWIAHSQKSYLASLRPEMRRLLSHFRLSDVALKAVGVGSVGTRCAIGLLVCDDPNEVLILQSKQAMTSILEPYLPSEQLEHEGERVVHGQRLMQTASDSFLGWSSNMIGQQFYRRHFRDWKGSVDVSRLDAAALTDYAKLCALTLAKAHARSGDRRALSTYLEREQGLEEALQAQALMHAQWAEGDHRQLLEAMAK